MILEIDTFSDPCTGHFLHSGLNKSRFYCVSRTFCPSSSVSLSIFVTTLDFSLFGSETTKLKLGFLDCRLFWFYKRFSNWSIWFETELTLVFKWNFSSITDLIYCSIFSDTKFVLISPPKFQALHLVQFGRGSSVTCPCARHMDFATNAFACQSLREFSFYPFSFPMGLAFWLMWALIRFQFLQILSMPLTSSHRYKGLVVHIVLPFPEIENSFLK